MAKLIDLTGQVFDKLTVLEKAQSRARHVYWKCRCDCGNIIEVSGESLKRNIPHNCGCVKQKEQEEKEKIKENKKNYLIGKRFGKLVVIERTDKKINRSIVWKCKCDCGNYKEVPTHLLQNGHTRSCGCLIREAHANDLAGQKFDKLTVLYPCDYKTDSNIIWHCKCDCGNECDVKSYLLKKGLTQSCGCISSSIGEMNIQKILNNNNIQYKKEYTIKDLGKLRFDFAIFKNNNLIRLIEFDGIQHFSEHTGVWNSKDSLKERQKRDNIKNKYCKDNNIPLVRIPYWERDNITLDMIMGDKYLIK